MFPLSCYQDDLRRANRDLGKGKEEMKTLTSKIGKHRTNVINDIVINYLIFFLFL